MNVEEVVSALESEGWSVADSGSGGMYPAEYVAGPVPAEWAKSPVVAADLLERMFPGAHVEIAYSRSRGAPRSRYVVFPDGSDAVQQSALGALYTVLMFAELEADELPEPLAEIAAKSDDGAPC